MRSYLALLITVFAAFTITSCHKKALRGEGPTVSETRFVGSFSQIEANGSSEVKIVYDSAYSVIVTGHSNLVPAYETKIVGDRLVLQYNEKYWNVRNDNIRVEVHTPYVGRLKLNGSGNIGVNSGFDQDNFDVEINGSGNILVGRCFYGTLKAEINGSGNFNAEAADADNVYARISGSGNIYVYVINYLDARISGSGDIYYSGDPKSVYIDVSGSGSVHKRN